MAKTNDSLDEDISNQVKLKRKRHSSGSGALFLILLGIIFLLNNFGFLPWSVWGNIWRFWPLILVGIGLNMIFSGYWFTSLLISLIFLVLIFLASISALSSTNSSFKSWVDQNLPFITSNLNFNKDILNKQLTVTQSQFPGISQREIQLPLGSGTMEIIDSQRANYLDLNAQYNWGAGEPDIQASSSSGKLLIEMSLKNHGMMLFGNPSYHVEIGQPQIPTDLKLDMGSGSSAIEFNELKVGNIGLQLGSGDLKAKFSKNSTPRAINLRQGSGDSDINLSSAIGIKVVYQIGSGDVKILGNNYNGNGMVTSNGYDQAETKVDINLQIGSGAVTISTE